MKKEGKCIAETAQCPANNAHYTDATQSLHLCFAVIYTPCQKIVTAWNRRDWITINRRRHLPLHSVGAMQAEATGHLKIRYKDGEEQKIPKQANRRVTGWCCLHVRHKKSLDLSGPLKTCSQYMISTANGYQTGATVVRSGPRSGDDTL